MANKVNPPPVPDDFTYNGQTLGTVTPYDSQGAWDAGPDQPIVLSDFKKAVNDGIKNTNTEIQLMFNADPTNPGLYQMFGNIWPEARNLDVCIPGPDAGWQDRLQTEFIRNSKKIKNQSATGSGAESAAADLVQVSVGE